MTQHPENAWPLTDTEPGYYPGANPTPTPPPAPMAPYIQPVPPAPRPATRPPSGGITPGMRIAYLAIILGVSIPLTAIAAAEIGLLGMIIVWAGIVLVSGIVFGSSSRRS